MTHRIWLTAFLATVGGIGFAAEGRLAVGGRGPAFPVAFRQAKPDKGPDKAPASKGVDVNQLSMEVRALVALHALQTTPAQMKALQALVKEEFVKPTKRQPVEVSPALRKNLGLLRQALVQNVEEDVKLFTNKVDVLSEDEELDDLVEVTRAASVPAREALRLFSPRQILASLATYKDNLPEPTDVLLDTLDEGTTIKPEEWKESRDAAAFKVAWLVKGLYTPSSEKLAPEVKKWLDARHTLKAAELQKQKAKLRREAREELMSNLNPLAVLANIALHDMAELLCNPRLPAALKARLEAEAKAK